MTRDDQEERLRILSVKVYEATQRLAALDMANTYGLSAAEHTALGAQYKMAQADVLRARRALDDEALAASYRTFD